MLQQIIDFLVNFYQAIFPFFVVDAYQNAVVLRLGKFNRKVTPGFHWKWPVIEDVITEIIATTTLNGDFQSLTTRDGKNIVVRSVTKYHVADVEIFTIKVTDALDALGDIILGETKKIIISRTWEECRSELLDNEITKSVRREAKKWGVDVDSVTITDLALMRSIRLLQAQII